MFESKHYILWMSPHAKECPGRIIRSPGRYVTQLYQAAYGLREVDPPAGLVHLKAMQLADYAIGQSEEKSRRVFRESKNRRGYGLRNNNLVRYIQQLLPDETSIEQSESGEPALVFTERGWRIFELFVDESQFG